MRPTAAKILKTYVTLTLLSTFASSFIWGINTLFLLDAGLSITEAFAANAFFTVGQVLFEVPTGAVADMIGRRTSYLLGAATLFGSTIFYLLLWHAHGPFWAWALASILLGLGFTFFSGATEAWLVDGLKATNFKGGLEMAFARGQIANGVAMLFGTVAGGVIAQVTNLGVPYILRAVTLAVTFFVTFWLMHDVGFKPSKNRSPIQEIRTIVRTSIKFGLRKRPVRWVMLASPFTAGVSIYCFYAMQPYLLQLYGNSGSYAIAGLAAAIVAGTQIVGGLLVPHIRRVFQRRTSLLLAAVILGSLSLLLIGLTGNFWVALGLLIVWAVTFSASEPVRQAFINGLIPSKQRATVLSSDNLLGSAGGVITQPGLGKVADAWGYSASFMVSTAVQVAALPFLFLARRERAVSDPVTGAQKAPVTPPSPTEPPADPIH